MPARVRVWVGAAIALVVIAYVVLVVAVPRDGDEADTEDGAVAPAPVVAAPDPDVGVDPALIASLDALIADRSSALPETADNATLTDLSRDGDALTYHYIVGIDIDAVQLSDPLPPALTSFDCDEDICVEVEPAFVAAACSDPAYAGLIGQGARVFLEYRDINTQPLAVVALSSEVCGA